MKLQLSIFYLENVYLSRILYLKELSESIEDNGNIKKYIDKNQVTVKLT